jgi:hypothetical protein
MSRCPFLGKLCSIKCCLEKIVTHGKISTFSIISPFSCGNQKIHQYAHSSATSLSTKCIACKVVLVVNVSAPFWENYVLSNAV